MRTQNVFNYQIIECVYFSYENFCIILNIFAQLKHICSRVYNRKAKPIPKFQENGFRNVTTVVNFLRDSNDK